MNFTLNLKDDREAAIDFACRLPAITAVTGSTARGATFLYQNTAIELRVASPDEYGTMLFTATGAPAHVEAVTRRRGRPAICGTETEVYAHAGLPWIPPELRNGTTEIEAAVTALLAGGHLLIEDVPGVGKTMLARSVARSIRGSFKRIQATPDLLPADITGSSVFDQEAKSFRFIEGPVFANVVLIDEINRTTPRTQSALLEAMDEAAVTVDGTRHVLPDPIFFVATQNPLEHHGTYPLPEGQLDRFTIAMELGYVSAPVERDIVRSQLEAHPIEELEPVIGPEEVIGVKQVVRRTHVSDSVLDYALALTNATRTHPEVELGASPRATIALVRCAKRRLS